MNPRSAAGLRVLPLVAAALLLRPHDASGGAGFDVRLRMDAASAERLLDLMDGRGNPSDVATLPGSRITRATTALIENEALGEDLLRTRLEELKYGHLVAEEPFQLAAARRDAPAIRDLLREMQTRNFARRVVATVEPLFPPSVDLAADIPLYVVAFGHSSITAFVRRVEWRGGEPLFVGEGQGEPVIVLNLGSSVHSGSTTAERFVWTLSVCAHEVFHALFAVLKDGTPSWRSYYAGGQGPLDALLDLTQNEGVAYHLTYEQQPGERGPEGDGRVRAAFSAFDRAAAELSSPGLSPGRAGELLRAANTSAGGESYGAMTGVVMARAIDRELGRSALAESLLRTPGDFFRTYIALAKSRGLPGFGAQTEELLQKAR